MNKFIFTICLVTTLALSSCERQINKCVSGDGNNTTRTINLDRDISKIELQIEAEVFISESDTQEITIEGDANLIDLIESDSNLSGDTWEIEIDECSDTDGLKIFATLKSLQTLVIQGSGKFKMEDRGFEGIDKLDLKIEGSGKVDLKIISANKIQSTVDGSGDIEVEGESKELDVKINGSGKMKFHKLVSDNVKVTLNGSGDIEVNAQNTLDIKINGSGEVCYKGNPQIDSEILGSGSIKNCN